jgi:hypothetical protein
MKRRIFNFSLCFVLCLSFLTIGRGQDVRRPCAIVGSGSSPHAIVWTNLVDASVGVGNTLEPSAGTYTAGGSSTHQLDASTDGYVEIVVAQTVGFNRGFGLGTTNTGGGFARIEFCFVCFGGTLYVFESGANIATIGSVTLTDVLRINRAAGGTVIYKVNGSTVHTSGSTNTGVLYGNAYGEGVGHIMENIVLSATFQ